MHIKNGKASRYNKLPNKNTTVKIFEAHVQSHQARPLCDIFNMVEETPCTV